MPATLELTPETEERLREEARRHGSPPEALSQSLSPQAKTPVVLLTGFEPFKGHKTNPSQQVAERLSGATVGGARVVGLTLPVVYGEDTAAIFAAITNHKPALVLSLGLAAGATCLEVERFAVNSRWIELGQEAQAPIITGGPAAYFATIDAERVAQAVRERTQVPARAHGDAGAYLCNHILYRTLHFAEMNSLPLKVGFIHLPLSSEQTVCENEPHRPSLPLESLVAGVRAAIEAALA